MLSFLSMEKNWAILEFLKFCDKSAGRFLFFLKKKGSTHVFTELITSTIKAEYYSAMVCVRGMISSRWYLLSTPGDNESDCCESSLAGEKFKTSGWSFSRITLRRADFSLLGDSDMVKGKMTTGADLICRSMRTSEAPGAWAQASRGFESHNSDAERRTLTVVWQSHLNFENMLHNSWPTLRRADFPLLVLGDSDMVKGKMTIGASHLDHPGPYMP